MASRLLGDEWYAWEQGGSFEIDDRFDVRVVVYRQLTRAEVARAYPTDVGRADYRYVAHAEALTYLDARLAELAGETDRPLRQLAQELERTRAQIVRFLGA